MLGKTAGGLFWMFRYLERCESTARLLNAGFHIAQTRASAAEGEWASVVRSAGVLPLFEARNESYSEALVIDFLLRDRSNPSSVVSAINSARQNARLVRTAITREVWEAVNESWLILTATLTDPVRERELPEILGKIRRQSALVRGAMSGTMLRNDIYDFARLGTFVERADNTARILDVKYYVLLPSVGQVGSSLDNVQWETILRAVSAQRAYRWLGERETGPVGITEFLVLDRRLPRSLVFCCNEIKSGLDHLADQYGEHHRCHEVASSMAVRLSAQTISSIFEWGLHEFLQDFIRDNNALSTQIELDYRFNG